MAVSFHQLEVKNIIKETKHTVSIQFNIPENLKSEFEYQAGQYLTIKQAINGEEIRRSYSISSSKEFGEELKISSKMIPNGRMSSYLFQELGIGDELEVMPPMGNFVVKDLQKPLVLFAAGSGITPIISILKQALSDSSREVYLFYGNRTEEDIIFKSELEQLQSQYQSRLLVQHYLSSQGERIDRDRTQSLMEGLNGDLNDFQYFICGPEAMIEAVKIGLESKGVSDNNINIEYFTSSDSPKEAPNNSSNPNEVTVVIDESTHQLELMPGEFILDAAEREGLDPPYSCQSGVCTTCKAKLLNGEVHMENNLGLGAEEVNEGYILACISSPTTAGVKVSWDED